MSANLHDILRAHAKHPAKIAIETPDGARISYGELFARAGRMARALADLGVEPGDRVAAQIDKSPDAIVLALACFRAGAALLPLNTAYTLAELEYFLGDAEPALTLCRPAQLDAVRALGGKLELARGRKPRRPRRRRRSPSASRRRARNCRGRPRGPNDLAAILYTSGTTGRSKGAMLTHENLVVQRRGAGRPVALHGRRRADPRAADLSHARAVRRHQRRADGRRDDDLPAEVRRRRGHGGACRARPSLMGVPTFYTRLLDHPGLTREATEHMRLFVSGSAPLLAETHERWREQTGHAILERYGMTETNMITSNPYDGERIAGHGRLSAAGRQPAHRRSRERRERCPQGEVGVIEVKGPNVFKGYWRMPEKTAAEFRPDGFFITGDLGKIDERGYVHIVGRAKDLIISGGFNVYPKEVESEIDAIAGVVESAVIGLPHPDFGEGVTAVVVLRAGAALDERAISEALEGRLARSRRPSACSSSTNCRATRWARCRRRRCGRPTKIPFRARPK